MNNVDIRAIEAAAQIQRIRGVAVRAWASSPEVRASFGGDMEAFIAHRVAAAQAVGTPFAKGSMSAPTPALVRPCGAAIGTVGASPVRGPAAGTPAAWLDLDRRAAAKWAADGALRKEWRGYSVADFQRYTRFTGGKFL